MRKATAGNGGAIDREPSAPQSTPSATPLYVLVVHRSCGRYRRRCDMQLKSAETAVARARARGEYAEIVLCRVIPVGVVA